MCTTCGCSDAARPTITNLETGARVFVDEHAHGHRHAHDHGHAHDHSHEHGHHHHEHPHAHDHEHRATVELGRSVLAKNDLLAARNRGWFEGRGILALNLVSSPGAGKTTLLVRTLGDLAGELEISVVEGDQETANDALRIRETGCPVIQVNTGTGCHLEADMLARGLGELRPSSGSVVMIENVGNLVCPALFDLAMMLRWSPPEPFVAGLVRGYQQESDEPLPDDWRRVTGWWDLHNLLGFLGREDLDPVCEQDVLRRVRELVEA